MLIADIRFLFEDCIVYNVNSNKTVNTDYIPTT